MFYKNTPKHPFLVQQQKSNNKCIFYISIYRILNYSITSGYWVIFVKFEH